MIIKLINIWYFQLKSREGLVMNQEKIAPLAGVRVLDLSRVLAGPMCAQTLGDFGAEVIKIEHPKRGDDTRDWGIRVGETETTYFNSVNRNKKSICLDLKQPQAIEIIHELVKKSDVVIQNFISGGADKLGIGYEQLSEINPKIIYCSIQGYNSQTNEATRPGYDVIIQGQAGLMAVNGEDSQPPLKFGVAVVDMFTGMYAAQAVLAALIERQKTNQGRHIELALYDCGLTIPAYVGLDALQLKKDPPRYGNAHPSIIPYGVFQAKDGAVIIGVGTNSQFQKFCEHVIECPEIAQDEKFVTNQQRGKHRHQLMDLVGEALSKIDKATVLARLAECGIPSGEVSGLYEALTSQRTQDTQMLTQYHHPIAGEMQVFSPPYRFDGQRLQVHLPPPVLGHDSDECLQKILNLDEKQLADLKAKNIIR